MDYNTLVEEIVKRVAQRINDFECAQSKVTQKANLLVIAPENCNESNSIFTNKCIKEQCDIDCALNQNYNVDIEKYDAVVLFGFSIDLLCRLYSGVCDTAFSSLVQKAILLDKKIYVPKEEVELLNFCTSKANVYYNSLNKKLDALKSCGITICSCSDIENAILSGCKLKQVDKKPLAAQVNTNLQTIKLAKKIITEKDMSAAKADKAGAVCITKKAILTDLAKEYAHKYSLTIIREDS